MGQRDAPEEHDDGHEERHEGYDNNQVDAGFGLLLLYTRLSEITLWRWSTS